MRESESKLVEPKLYFTLFKGARVSLNQLLEETPTVSSAIDALVRDKRVVGQRMLPVEGLKSDTIVWMPEYQPKIDTGNGTL